MTSRLRRKQLRKSFDDRARRILVTVVAAAPSTTALALPETRSAADPRHERADRKRLPRERASRTLWQRGRLWALDANAPARLRGWGARSSGDVLDPPKDATHVHRPQVLMDPLRTDREQESHD